MAPPDEHGRIIPSASLDRLPLPLGHTRAGTEPPSRARPNLKSALPHLYRSSFRLRRGENVDRDAERAASAEGLTSYIRERGLGGSLRVAEDSGLPDRHGEGGAIAPLSKTQPPQHEDKVTPPAQRTQQLRSRMSGVLGRPPVNIGAKATPDLSTETTLQASGHISPSSLVCP